MQCLPIPRMSVPSSDAVAVYREGTSISTMIIVSGSIHQYTDGDEITDREEYTHILPELRDVQNQADDGCYKAADGLP